MAARRRFPDSAVLDRDGGATALLGVPTILLLAGLGALTVVGYLVLARVTRDWFEAQLAAPSRTKIPRYQELNERVEQLAAAINARWSSGSYRPIALLRSHHEPTTVFVTIVPPSSAT